MRIAYLVNRYPVVSHTFIRREIHALEMVGISIERFSIRGSDDILIDIDDQLENQKTTAIIHQKLNSLLFSIFVVACKNPRGFFRAFKLTTQAIVRDPSNGLRYLAYLIEASWLSSNLNGIDHIHAHFGTNPTAVARLTSYLTGIPYSFTAHGPDEFDAPRQIDLAGKIADAKHVMAVSYFGLSQLMRWSEHQHWQKLCVIPCGIDSVFVEEPPKITRSTTTFCCVARLNAQKGLPILILAAHRLLQMGFEFRLVLVGDGEMRKEIEAMIKFYHLENNVELTGFLDSTDVRNIMLSATALVLPSFAEGLPVVIMEALAMRTPVIATAIAGIPELVDSECGWPITAGSIEDLVAAMRDVLESNCDDLLKKGENGRDRVLKNHVSQNIGLQLSGIFRP